MTQPLKGKVVWITGAGSGIGEAAALSLSGAGATIIASGRREAPLQELARRIGGAAMAADVGQPEAASKTVDQIIAKFGRLDIVVNNAGLNIANRRLEQLTPQAIDQVLATNLNGAFYCAVAALKPMREQKDGVLIHTGSWVSRHWSIIGGAAYQASKTAVLSMSHSINLEESKNGIRSTVVMPAEVNTPILEQRPQPPSPDVRARMLQQSDLGELILFVATRPAHVCINEVIISPVANKLL